MVASVVFYDEFSFPIRVARLALLTSAGLRVKRNEISRVVAIFFSLY